MREANATVWGFKQKKEYTIRSASGYLVKHPCLKLFSEMYSFPLSNSANQVIHSIFSS